MAEEYLRIDVHDEFAARIEAEERRQNARIDKLENIMDEIHEQTISIKTMAASIDTMSQELKRHSDRLDQLEAEPANKWRRLMDGIIGAAAALVGAGIIYAVISSIH